MIKILTVLTLAAMLVALYFTFVYAPVERTMGDVQRIFYFHVPSAWIAFLAFFIVFVASILFLVNGHAFMDTLAFCSAEIGVLFISLVLLTGPLWAKPVWGTYWTWDARLTTSLVLWLIYIAYLMLRTQIPRQQKAARLAAVFGIIGFVDVPVVYMSIRWWRTLHPQPVLAGGNGSGLEPKMLTALFVCLAVFTLLFVMLLLLRTRIALAEKQLAFLRVKIQGKDV